MKARVLLVTAVQTLLAYFKVVDEGWVHTDQLVSLHVQRGRQSLKCRVKILQFGDGWTSVGCHVNVSLIVRATVCVVEVGLGMRLHVNVGGSSPHPVELFRCKCGLSKKRHA